MNQKPARPGQRPGTRINKYLSDRGLCSRREADRWIEDGRVEIDGRRAQNGDRVLEGSEVRVNGEILDAELGPRVVYAYHKPRGIECTEDRDNPDAFIHHVPIRERVFSVGRLDKYSEGLLLLTNRGEIVNDLLKGASGIEKDYHVYSNEDVEEPLLRELEAGIDIEGRRTRPCRIQKLGPRHFKFTLIEGLNRQIRRMLESVDRRAQRIVRVRIGSVTLGALKAGEYRELDSEAVEHLLALKLRPSKILRDGDLGEFEDS